MKLVHAYLVRALFFFINLFFSPAFGAEQYVSVTESSLFEEAEGEQSLGVLPKGKRVLILEKKRGWVRLWSRSHQDRWALASDFQARTETSELEADTEALFPSPGDFKRVRLDLGAAGGSEGTDSFLEVALGVEYFMMERLSLRNSFFYRLSEFNENFFGWDLSVRANGKLRLGALGLRGILGIGYRFPARGRPVPIGEVGGFAELIGFDLGLMLKFVPQNLINGVGNDVVVYSVVFSGDAGYF